MSNAEKAAESRNEIVTDEELIKAWGYANFGDRSKREVVLEALQKITRGYHNGHTATCICKELGLIENRGKGHVLTDKGLKYLLAESQPTPESVAVAFGEWIPVEKELPEVGEYVLINVGTDTVLKGRLMHNGWVAFFMDGQNKVGEIRPVTHWMPLPNPPHSPEYKALNGKP